MGTPKAVIVDQNSACMLKIIFNISLYLVHNLSQWTAMYLTKLSNCSQLTLYVIGTLNVASCKWYSWCMLSLKTHFHIWNHPSGHYSCLSQNASKEVWLSKNWTGNRMTRYAKIVLLYIWSCVSIRLIAHQLFYMMHYRYPWKIGTGFTPNALK